MEATVAYARARCAGCHAGIAPTTSPHKLLSNPGVCEDAFPRSNTCILQSQCVACCGCIVCSMCAHTIFPNSPSSLQLRRWHSGSSMWLLCVAMTWRTSLYLVRTCLVSTRLSTTSWAASSSSLPCGSTPQVHVNKGPSERHVVSFGCAADSCINQSLTSREGLPSQHTPPGTWLSWADVVAVAKELELPVVPLVFEGTVSSLGQVQAIMAEAAVKSSAAGHLARPEGFVLR